VGLHSANPVSGPMARLFIDLMCPLTRSKQGNLAILVLLDALYFFFRVRKISSQVVCKMERAFFTSYGTPDSLGADNAKVFRCKQIRDVFGGELPI
jgi:hypothetical protein